MGKSAGKIELAWYRINGAAPWGYIFLALFFVGVIGLAVADLTVGISGNGENYSCRRGMSLDDNC